MLPSTRHAVYPIYPRGEIIINHVNFTITDVPVLRTAKNAPFAF